MVRRNKKKGLVVVSKQLELHRPDLKAHFVCPICLNIFSLKDEAKITEAHIIPDAVGGKISTYACKQCNDRAGKLQDKWLGEHLKISQSPAGIFNGNPTGFVFGDVKLKGKVETEVKDNAVSLTLKFDYKHNSPDMRDRIDSMLEEAYKKYDGINKVPVGLGVYTPVLGKQEMVNVGFLTAGYLMWFKILGYSWVFQKHLQPIREQIINPDKIIIPQEFIGSDSRWDWKEPWIGAATVKGKLALVFGYHHQITFFPPRDEPDLYHILNASTQPRDVRNVVILNDINKIREREPLCIACNNRVIIGSDDLESNKPFVLQFSYPPMIGRPLVGMDYASFKNSNI